MCYNLKTLLLFFSLIISSQILAQSSIISGKVIDAKGLSIAGANVYLQGTYDGSTTDENGNFSFKTSETGSQTLLVI